MDFGATIEPLAKTASCPLKSGNQFLTTADDGEEYVRGGLFPCNHLMKTVTRNTNGFQ